MKHNLWAVLLVGWVWMAWGSFTAPRPPSMIAPAVWEASAAGEPVEFLVLLKAQADLTPAARLADGASRRAWIYRTLQAQAAQTQAPLRRWLETRKIPYRAFYIVNMVWVRGDRTVLLALAERPEVARIIANPSSRLPDLPAAGPGMVRAVGWNLEQIGAPAVWALGDTGQGIVVAGQDTGYAWAHPALHDRYRGWDGQQAIHDYSWHDAIHADNPHTPAGNPCGFDSPVPCDDHSHGTHTMGIMVGDDGAGAPTGVAPGARWIGCRNMEEQWGTPASYAECFEFFLAPYPVGGTPAQGNPALAPDVINNSWTCTAAEGCDAQMLREVVATVRAAGIWVVAAAGNNGPGCSTIIDPPGIAPAAYTIGATGAGDGLAGFSGRGPVTADGSGRLKPDLVAPGESIWSTVPGGYGWSSGTSMAAPHVAGAAALLWSAAPTLTGRLTETEALLAATAHPIPSTECGGNGVPNPLYGWGRLDIEAAVQAVWEEPGTLAGQVTDAAGAPLTATLTLSRPLAAVTVITSGPAGLYRIALSPATYTVRAAAPDYLTRTVTDVQVTSGATTTLPLSLTFCVPITLSGVSYVPQFPKTGERVTFTVSATGGISPLTYRWNFGPGEPDALGATVVHQFTPAVSRAYTVEVRVSDACRETGEWVMVPVQARTLYLPVVLKSGSSGSSRAGDF